MNDTMGIHWKGKYHIFYLHNPDAPVWRQATNWAQAYSTDLISSFLPVVTASSCALPLFVFFAVMMALQFFVVLFVYPETKTVSLERMQWKLGIQ